MKFFGEMDVPFCISTSAPPSLLYFSTPSVVMEVLPCLSRPELTRVPMAVCGSVGERHGIVLAKNPPARAMGVKTAEAVWQAKQKCPEPVSYTHLAPAVVRRFVRGRLRHIP